MLGHDRQCHEFRERATVMVARFFIGGIDAQPRSFAR
jgi:hypothetical protein